MTGVVKFMTSPLTTTVSATGTVSQAQMEKSPRCKTSALSWNSSCVELVSTVWASVVKYTAREIVTKAVRQKKKHPTNALTLAD
jgi:hypothetical protein